MPCSRLSGCGLGGSCSSGAGAEAAHVLGRAARPEGGVGQGGEAEVVADARDEVGEGLVVEVLAVELWVGLWVGLWEVVVGCFGALARLGVLSVGFGAVRAALARAEAAVIAAPRAAFL